MPVTKPKALDVMKIMIDQFRLGDQYVEFERKYLDWERRKEEHVSEINKRAKKLLPKFLMAETAALNAEHFHILKAWESFAPVAPFYAAVQYWRYQDQQRKEEENNGKIQTESDEEEGLHQRDRLSVGEAG